MKNENKLRAVLPSSKHRELSRGKNRAWSRQKREQRRIAHASRLVFAIHTFIREPTGDPGQSTERQDRHNVNGRRREREATHLGTNQQEAAVKQ